MRSLGNVPVDVVSKRCREEFTFARTLETKCILLLGRVSIHLWLVLSNQIRQHAAHAPNCLMFDCDGVKRIETVVCQDYEESDRNLTKSAGRVEKDVVTLDEEKGEVTFVKEGHDVERVTAFLEDP